MRVLSIDWDYFFEENPMLDYGHKEEVLFLDVLWRIRRSRALVDRNGKIQERQIVDLTKEIPQRVDPFMIVGAAFNAKPRTIAVAESHAAIVKLLKNADDVELINVDAHHDLHYGEVGRLPKKFNCGNWGSALIEAGKVTRWTQVYPTWRRNYPEDDNGVFTWARKQLGSRFHVLYDDAFTFTPRSSDLLFLCRSGCWIPPEYDKKFTSVCKVLGVQPLAERSLEVADA